MWILQEKEKDIQRKRYEDSKKGIKSPGFSGSGGGGFGSSGGFGGGSGPFPNATPLPDTVSTPQVSWQLFVKIYKSH